MRYLRKKQSALTMLATIADGGHRRLVSIAPAKLCERVWRCMQAGILPTLAHLAQYVGLSEGQTRKHLNCLVRLAVLQRDGEGWILAAPKPCPRCGGARVQPVPLHRDLTRHRTYCPRCTADPTAPVWAGVVRPDRTVAA